MDGDGQAGRGCRLDGVSEACAHREAFPLPRGTKGTLQWLGELGWRSAAVVLSASIYLKKKKKWAGKRKKSLSAARKF